MKINGNGFRLIFSLLIITGVMLYGPGPAYSQQGDGSNLQNLLVNGGFEGGFQQDFGIGYGWGGFSNGNAAVGWNFDNWQPVVTAGQYAQMVEIKNAQEMDRYAGIYQTINVVPGEQYKLTIKGIIRSSEGNIEDSNYGYRLQYGIDYDGGKTWELVDPSAWQEVPWDEQPLAGVPGSGYRVDTFETTITAQNDQLTLFIRGWKKWINNGSGIFDLDEISFIGPAPEGFQAPLAQAAPVNQDQVETVAAAAPITEQQVEPETDLTSNEKTLPAPAEEPNTATENTTVEELTAPTETKIDEAPVEETAPQTLVTIQQNQAPAPETAPLPVSGRGSEDTNIMVVIGGVLLLILVGGAVITTVRSRTLAE